MSVWTESERAFFDERVGFWRDQGDDAQLARERAGIETKNLVREKDEATKANKPLVELQRRVAAVEQRAGRLSKQTIEDWGETTAKAVKQYVEPLIERIKALESRNVMVYRGIFSVDAEYKRGDVTTADGGAWICLHETKGEKPGISPDWNLIMKGQPFMTFLIDGEAFESFNYGGKEYFHVGFEEMSDIHDRIVFALRSSGVKEVDIDIAASRGFKAAIDAIEKQRADENNRRGRLRVVT